MPITTRLQGGCGNQMFQYAMGLAQAIRLDTDLQIDTGKFKSDSMREYNLCLFPRIQNKIVEDLPITIGESGMPYNQAIVNSIKDGDVLNGYWQTEKYFKFGCDDIIPDLRELFQPKPLTPGHRKILHNIIESKNSTFIVIRRTDYVGNSFHGELPIEYYKEALEIVKFRTGIKPSVFVFSDEPEWCSKHLDIGQPFTVAGTFDRTVKGHIGREDADLFLMSMCQNAIIANSSFAWWGAWLGSQSRRRVIIAPKRWFGPASTEDYRDIVPSRWIKI